MTLKQDLKVLYHMALSPIRGKTHQERLESFYSKQAEDYDAFRHHLLQGRQEMYQSLPIPEGGVHVDMGGGTGWNLEYLGDKIHQLRKVYLVDLSASLLAVARKRIADHGWDHVQAVEADVTTFVPEEGTVDLVTFSYSLTMIPSWFAAIDQAIKLLRPGGVIGVVDFYVSRKYPAEGHRRHSWFRRSFWPVWMALDNVFVQDDQVPYLHYRFQPEHFSEHLARMRYLPFYRIPYYRFIGRKAG
jgi:S-adenosylmethionine-diacylgycerolhomoserine-N-methlytransferase